MSQAHNFSCRGHSFHIFYLNKNRHPSQSAFELIGARLLFFLETIPLDQELIGLLNYFILRPKKKYYFILIIIIKHKKQ